jgi:uncharacterized protein
MSRRAMHVLLSAAIGLLLAPATPGPAARAFGQVVPPAGQATQVTGTWQGSLEVGAGVRLRMVVHIEAAPDGSLTGRLDSPDQGVTGIPAANVRFEPPVLRFEVPSVLGQYEGSMQVGGTIAGTWSQGQVSLPLELVRVEGEIALERPQNPAPPFPYREEAVRFANPNAGIELAGTLTLPHGAGPFPAVALVSGSGAQDRDHTLFGHRTFLVIADHLTRAGIAVLRYDDRGVGESGGRFAGATSYDFAGDAAAAVTYLQRQGEVDANRIGLIGLSEGALIAPLVATGYAEAPRADLAFVVLLAPPAIPGDELLYAQSNAILTAMGAPAELRTASRALQEAMFAVIRAEPDPERRRDRLRAVLRTALDTMAAPVRAAQGIPADGEEAWLESQVEQVGGEWFRTFVMHDPRDPLRQLRVPLLALFGGLDLQVPPTENRSELEMALEVAANADATVTVLPGLNHLFQTATTGAPAEYGTITETIAPVALDTVRKWILARFGGR